MMLTDFSEASLWWDWLGLKRQEAGGSKQDFYLRHWLLNSPVKIALIKAILRPKALFHLRRKWIITFCKAAMKSIIYNLVVPLQKAGHVKIQKPKERTTVCPVQLCWLLFYRLSREALMPAALHVHREGRGLLGRRPWCRDMAVRDLTCWENTSPCWATQSSGSGHRSYRGAPRAEWSK